MKEIEIVGGGLSGLSLGIALRAHGVPVLLREASSYPRHRVCGEFINGVTEETLDVLGILPVFHDALRHHATRWWMGNRRILEAKLPRPALGMSRWEMDERLRRVFQGAGGILRTNDRAQALPRDGLVWSAGRHLEKKSQLLGLKAHFEGVELDGFLEMHIGEGTYLGLTPITADGSRVNVCGLFKRGPRTKGVNPIVDALRQSGLPALADRIAVATMDPKSLTGISGFNLGSQGGRSELCTLGDAERMIPPFTGNGMSMAFESAECALPHLLHYSCGDGAWEETREGIRASLNERFQKRVQLALGLHRCLTSEVGRTVLVSAATSGILPFSWLHRRLT
jgi:2-polyprenyl-6-methoxyphenol hydroxylase-like FAD-dependent oxidoreductase